jgi:hypothetical protein
MDDWQFMPVAAHELAPLFELQEESGASAMTVSKSGACARDKALRRHPS